MLARISLWILAAAVGQPAAEPAWLKAVPADVDVVIRTRGLDATEHDLHAWLKAASANLAAQAEPQLQGALNQMRTMHGDAATKTPWVGLIRVTAPGAGGGMPFAVMVLNDDYKGVLKGFSGGKEPANLKTAGGGLDSFDSPMGDGNWYAARGAGFVAIGPDRGLVSAVLKPQGKTLDQMLSPDLTKALLAGDLGAYVNVDALATRYADAIEQARQGLLAAMDQAAQQQQGNAKSMEAAKKMYETAFASLKDASRLTVSFDFSENDAKLASVLALKPGTATAKGIDPARAGTAADLGRLPADGAVYVYFDSDATMVQKFMGMSMQSLTPDGKTPAALERATAGFSGLGRTRTYGEFTSAGGVRGVHVVDVADPAKYIAASLAMNRSFKDPTVANGTYKDVQITEGVETARGFRFDRIVAKLDLEKLAQAQGGGQTQVNADAFRALMGGDVQTAWIGTDGKRVIQIMSPSWNDARARLERFLDGKDSIGSSAAYKSVRAALPAEAGFLTLMNPQWMVDLMAMVQSKSSVKAKPAGDRPQEPVLMGVSLTPRAGSAYEVHLVVPSAVGPVIEKGFAPAMQGQPARP